MHKDSNNTQHPDYFNRLVQFGEFVDPAVVESAGRLLLASDAYHVAKLSELQSPNASEPVDPIQRYVDAARYGDYILSGRVELDKNAQELVSKDDIANVLGHLRLFDKMQSGALVGRFVGLKLPEEDDVSISQKAKYDLAFERNNAIIQAGRIWNGIGLEKFDSKPIHEARAKIGEAAYAEFGPDLGPNLTALAYSSVLHTVALTEDLRHRIPEQISKEVAGRYRTSTLHKTQVNAGRVAIIDKLTNTEPAFPIDQARLQETMTSWSEQLEAQVDKINYIQKLYHISDRQKPDWLNVATSIVNGEQPELGLANAYRLHSALKSIASFQPDSEGFKMYRIILANAPIVAILKRAYEEAQIPFPAPLIIANAAVEGLSVPKIIEENNIPNVSAVGRAVSLVEKAALTIPEGTNPDRAVKLIQKNLTLPGSRKFLPHAKSPKTAKPKPQPKPELESPVEPEHPIEFRTFTVEDIPNIPINIAKELILLSRASKKSIPTLLNEAVLNYQKTNKVNTWIKQAIELLEKEPDNE